MSGHLARGMCVMLVAVLLVASVAGCATLFRCERVGRSPSQVGKLDWGWFVMDVMNILFLNPFPLITDFITGAIYMGTYEEPK